MKVYVISLLNAMIKAINDHVEERGRWNNYYFNYFQLNVIK